MKQLTSTPHFRATVTKEIVARGVARNSNHCMIAEAVKEAYPRLSHVSVDIQTIRASDRKKGQRYIWLTPRKVQTAIVAFDLGKRPRPFNFALTSGQTVPIAVKSPEEKAKMIKAYHEKYKPLRAKKKKAELRRGHNGSSGSVPNVIGGVAPPKSVGARRSFGLRSLQY